MTMKKVLVVLVAVIFAISLVGLAFAANEVSGKITKMDGNKLTIKTMDKDVTVEVQSAKGLKVGDEVVVKDGVAKKAEKKKATGGY